MSSVTTTNVISIVTAASTLSLGIAGVYWKISEIKKSDLDKRADLLNKTSEALDKIYEDRLASYKKAQKELQRLDTKMKSLDEDELKRIMDIKETLKTKLSVAMTAAASSSSGVKVRQSLVDTYEANCASMMTLTSEIADIVEKIKKQQAAAREKAKKEKEAKRLRDLAAAMEEGEAGPSTIRNPSGARKDSSASSEDSFRTAESHRSTTSTGSGNSSGSGNSTSGSGNSSSGSSARASGNDAKARKARGKVVKRVG